MDDALAAVTVPPGLKAGLSEAIRSVRARGALVLAHHGRLALTALQDDRRDLGAEQAGRLRRLRPPGGFRRVGVLVGPREALALGAALGAQSHVHAVVRVPEAIVDQAVGELGVAHARAAPRRAQ